MQTDTLLCFILVRAQYWMKGLSYKVSPRQKMFLCSDSVVIVVVVVPTVQCSESCHMTHREFYDAQCGHNTHVH
jgi:hypothetical protein